MKLTQGLNSVNLWQIKKGDWLVVWYDKDGNRQRLSRKRKEDAEIEAQNLLNQLGEGIPSYVSARGLAYYQEQEARLKGVPLHVAVSDYIRRQTESDGEPVPLGQVVKEFLRSQEEKGVKTSYLRGQRAHLNGLPAEAKITEARVQELTAYLNQWEDPTTRNNVRRSLVQMFRWARDYAGYLAEDKKTAAEKLPVAIQKTKEPEIYSPEELKALLDAAPAQALPFLLLGAFAGLRSCESKALTYGDLRWGDGVIVVNSPKTGKRRLVPIDPALHAWWYDFGFDIDDKLVPAGIYDMVPDCVPWKDNGLRHSYVSYELARTGNQAQTALHAGHSVAVQGQHYVNIRLEDGRLVTKELAERYFSLRPNLGAV